MTHTFLLPFGDVLEKKNIAYDMKFHSLCFHAVLDFHVVCTVSLF